MMLQLTPIDELLTSNFLVDLSSEYIQVKKLVLLPRVPELHWAQTDGGRLQP